MGVRDLALEAWARQEAEDRAERLSREQREERDRQEAQARKYQTAQELIARSPLGEWFPGEEWSIMDFARRGAAAGYGDGNEIVVAPRDRSVRLLLQDEGVWPAVRLRVYYVRQQVDTDTSYAYWDGPEVKSAADVGRQLEADVRRGAVKGIGA